jgi:hypothetical protein
LPCFALVWLLSPSGRNSTSVVTAIRQHIAERKSFDECVVLCCGVAVDGKLFYRELLPPHGTVSEVTARCVIFFSITINTTKPLRLNISTTMSSPQIASDRSAMQTCCFHSMVMHRTVVVVKFKTPLALLLFSLILTLSQNRGKDVG